MVAYEVWTKKREIDNRSVLLTITALTGGDTYISKQEPVYIETWHKTILKEGVALVDHNGKILMRGKN